VTNAQFAHPGVLCRRFQRGCPRLGRRDSTSTSTTQAWQARAVTVAPLSWLRFPRAQPQAVIPCSKPRGAIPARGPSPVVIQVTGRKRTGSHGPLFRSQMWVMVLVGAAPIPQLSHAGPRAGWPAAQAYGCRSPFVLRSSLALGGRQSAKRSPLMGRGQVQACGTCPLQNEHESAPDLVRRIRNGSRLATVGI
jgi:hypothetical protein